MRHDLEKISFPLLVAAACWLTGCATSSLEVGVATRAESYVEIDDRLGMLRARPARCAALPAIMTGVSDGRGVSADIAMDRVLRNAPREEAGDGQEPVVPLNILRHQEVVAMSVAAGRFDLLRSLLESMQPGNMLDPKGLKDLGALLDVEYVMVPQIVNVTTDNATRFSFAGFTFIMNGWITIEGTLQIWHAASGVLVWQSAGQGSLSSENLSGYPPPTQAAMNELFETLVGDFISGRRETVVQGRVEASPVTKQPTGTTGASDGATETSTIKTVKTVETVETVEPPKEDAGPTKPSKTPTTDPTAGTGSDS